MKEEEVEREMVTKERKAVILKELLELSTDYKQTGELLKELVGGIYDELLNR